MATSSPYASISGRNRAIQDTWRANLAAKGPLSRRETRNHAWCEDVAGAARPFRGSGLRSGRTGFATRGMAERALRPAARAWPACRMRPSLSSRLCPPRPAPLPSRPRSSPPSYTCRASLPASRPPMRARRHRLSPNPRQPDPSPAPAESRPARGAICAHPRPATRRASPCRAGSAAVLVIPAKWCGDTIAHTRKLRF